LGPLISPQKGKNFWEGKTKGFIIFFWGTPHKMVKNQKKLPKKKFNSPPLILKKKEFLGKKKIFPKNPIKKKKNGPTP